MRKGLDLCIIFERNGMRNGLRVEKKACESIVRVRVEKKVREESFVNLSYV